MEAVRAKLRFPPRLALAFVLLAAAVLAGGHGFYRSQEQLVRQNAESRLETIVKMKVDQVVRWRTERLGDAATISDSAMYAEWVARWLAEPAPDVTAHLLAWFRSLQTHYAYRDVLLVDPLGRVRLRLLDTTESIADSTQAALPIAFSQRRPVMTDLYRVTGNNATRLDVIAPLVAGPAGAAVPIAAVLLEVDAQQFLYPLIQSWPVPSASAETLMVERAGSDALFLNELRHQKDTALKLRVPLNREELPAARAILGATGLVIGRDYRGVEVLAALQAVPGTPWFMVAKEDAAEAFVSWRSRGGLILILIVLLLLGVFGGFWLVWQNQQRLHYQVLYETELSRGAAEARLEEQHRLFDAVLQGSPDAIFVKDLQGRYLLSNPANTAIVGRPVDDILGYDDTALFAADTASALMEADRRVMTTGQALVAEEAVPVDGEVRLYLTGKSPLRDGDGRITGLIGVAHDITARKRAQEQLAAAAEAREELLRELQEKSEELESLLYISSHDLRSPLVNIQGFSRRLEKTAADLAALLADDMSAGALREAARPLVEERIPTALRYVTTSANKMDQLINGLLRASRLGRVALNPAPLDMNRLMAAVLDAHAHQVGQARADVRIESLPFCWGDAGQINQVFSNLLDNALKYRDEQRPLLIRISGREEKGWAIYCVEDTGQGLKPEYREPIWRPFHRLEPNGAVAGEGLGLTLVKRIVQRHRGRVWLESEAGRGSRFFVALPREAPRSQGGAHSSNPDKDGGPI